MTQNAKLGGIARLAIAAAVMFAVALSAACGDADAETPTPAPSPSPRPLSLAATPSQATHTPSPAPTATPSPAPTETSSATPTHTPSATPTHTPTPAPTATPSPAPTHTPAPTPTHTPTPTATVTPTPTPSPAPTPAPTATHTPTPAPDARAVLTRSLEAMRAVESYRYSMNMDVTTQSDDVITNLPIAAEGVYRAPDSYSAVLELDAGFFGTFEIPIIAIGGDVYLQDPNFGEWQRMGAGQDLSYFDPEFIAFLANPAASISPDAVDGLRNLRLRGTGSADGVQTRIVSFELPEDGFNDPYPKLGEVEVKIEIGVEDSLMRRVEAVGELARNKFSPELAAPGGIPERGAALEPRISFRSTAALSGFNAVSETIKPPIISP